MSAALALAQEPWGFTPEQVGRVAFETAKRLYHRPARERAERWERDRRADAGDPGIQTEAEFVAVMTGQFGGDPAKWAADWHRIQAAGG